MAMGRLFLVFLAAVAAVWAGQHLFDRSATGQVVSGPPAGGPAAGRFLTPRSFDADGLEELFARVARTGGVAHLPGGTYRINRTVRISQAGAFRIEGEGMGDMFNPEGTGYQSRPTRLLWTGAPGGTLLSLDYSNGQSFSHIQFDGGGKAGALVALRSRPGFVANTIRFERVMFRATDVGVLCGEDEMDFCCGDLVFDEVYFAFCKAGLRTINHQSVNHYFRSLNVAHTEVGMDFVRGGNLVVDGWSASTFDLMLRVSYGGPNAGTFRFSGGRPEMNGYTRRYARLAEARNLHSADIIFDTTQETGGPYDDKLPDNSAEPVFHIGDNVTLNLRNHYHFRPAVKMDGGVYRDENVRWFIRPEDPGVIQHTGGEVEIVNPRTLVGQKMPELRKGSGR